MSDLLPRRVRIFLRKAGDSTLIGGQILDRLCADGRDRMWTGSIILVPEKKLVVPSKAHFEGGTGGMTLDQVLTSPHFSNPRTPPWEDDA